MKNLSQTFPSITKHALTCALLFCASTSLMSAQTVPTLREGDTVIKTELIDENGSPIALSDPKQDTVVTFIFTRCASMEFCPMMNAKFKALQTRAQQDPDIDPRLISITLEPEFDTPERLKEYSEAVGADPAIWHFATGSEESINTLTKAFRVFRDKSSGVLDHTLCTALITPDGKIKKIWRGNAWQVDEVVTALK